MAGMHGSLYSFRFVLIGTMFSFFNPSNLQVVCPYHIKVILEVTTVHAMDHILIYLEELGKALLLETWTFHITQFQETIW